MPRGLLTILITWPLLMPPGFCICRVEAFMPRTAERPTVAVVRVQDETPATKCRCCRRAAEQTTPAEKSTTRQADSPSPSESHAPNCPASPTWEILRTGVFSPGGFDICGFLSLDLHVSGLCPTGIDLLSFLRVSAADIPPASSPSLISCNFRC